jgi:hypothetical protein
MYILTNQPVGVLWDLLRANAQVKNTSQAELALNVHVVQSQVSNVPSAHYYEHALYWHETDALK